MIEQICLIWFVVFGEMRRDCICDTYNIYAIVCETDIRNSQTIGVGIIKKKWFQLQSFKLLASKRACEQ